MPAILLSCLRPLLVALVCTTAGLAAVPSVTVTPTGITVATSPITFTITFSEPVSGLTAGELAVSGGTLAGLQRTAADSLSRIWLATVNVAA